MQSGVILLSATERFTRIPPNIRVFNGDRPEEANDRFDHPQTARVLFFANTTISATPGPFHYEWNEIVIYYIKNTLYEIQLLPLLSRPIFIQMQPEFNLCALLPVPKNSVRSHIVAINKLLTGDLFHPPETDTLEAIRRHFDSEGFSNLCDSSRNTIVQAVKRQLIQACPAYFTDLPVRYAIDEFFRSQKRKTQVSVRGRVLSPDQVVQLCSAAGEKTYLMACFLSLGLRVSEMTGIRLRDIGGAYYNPIDGRQYDNEIVVRIHGKGRTMRDILVPRWLLDRARTVFEGELFLFETSSHRKYSRQEVYSLITAAAKRVLGFHVSPHDFRKTFGTHMSVFPELMKQTMGHGGWQDGDVYRNHYVLVAPLRPHQIPPMQAVEKARDIRIRAS